MRKNSTYSNTYNTYNIYNTNTCNTGPPSESHKLDDLALHQAYRCLLQPQPVEPRLDLTPLLQVPAMVMQ